MRYSKIGLWRIAGAITIAAICALAFAYCRALTGGELVYALDDCYIHLQIARNLAEHGMWGIRPNEFAFGSSSPLWTCLLALTFKLAGFHEWIAGAYATLSCCAIAVVLDSVLVGIVRRSFLRYAVVVLMCLMLPVTTAAILGMEHALHALCMLFFLKLYLESDRSCWRTALCAMAAVGVRYESLFLILPLAFAALLQKRYVESVMSFWGAAAIPIAYGVFALSNGGCFLPNSLMMKSAISMEASFFTKLVDVVCCGASVKNAMVYFSGIASLVMSAHPSLGRRCRLGLLASAVAVFGHLVFARTGWIYNINRYEIYLFAVVPVMLTVAIFEISTRSAEGRYGSLLNSGFRCGYLLYMVLLLCFGLDSGFHALRAPVETYQTPLLAAKVLSSLPVDHRGGIFLNDLGLIAERTDQPIADVCGLGDQLTFDLLRKNERSADNMMKVLKERHVRYAAVYPMWSSTVLRDYAKMRAVAVAKGAEQTIWATGPLCFYAMTPDDERFLAQHLRNLPFPMPKGVSFAIRPDL